MELSQLFNIHVLADRSLDNRALTQIEHEAYVNAIRICWTRKDGFEVAIQIVTYPRTVKEALHKLNNEQPTFDIQKFSLFCNQTNVRKIHL